MASDTPLQPAVPMHWRIEANEGYSYVDDVDGDGPAIAAANALKQYLREAELVGSVYVYPYKCKCSYCGSVLKGQDEMERMVFALVSGRGVEQPVAQPVEPTDQASAPTMALCPYTRHPLSEYELGFERGKYHGWEWHQ